MNSRSLLQYGSQVLGLNSLIFPTVVASFTESDQVSSDSQSHESETGSETQFQTRTESPSESLARPKHRTELLFVALLTANDEMTAATELLKKISAAVGIESSQLFLHSDVMGSRPQSVSAAEMMQIQSARTVVLFGSQLKSLVESHLGAEAKALVVDDFQPLLLGDQEVKRRVWNQLKQLKRH